MELLSWVEEQQARLMRALTTRVDQKGQRLRDLARALRRPEELLDGPRQRFDIVSDRLPTALMRGVEKRRVALSEASGTLRPALLTRMVAEEKRRVDRASDRLEPGLRRAVDAKREALGRRADRLSLRPVEREIAVGKDRLEGLSRRLAEQGQRQIRGLQDRLDGLDRLRETLSYKATLERGYAVVRGDGQVIGSKAAAEAASGLEIEFADGRFKIGGTARKGGASKTKPPEQGSLF
jgi:exodeoxyribonuclease VII large subunit